MKTLKKELDCVVRSEGFTYLFERVSGQFANISFFLESQQKKDRQVDKLQSSLHLMLHALNLMSGAFDSSLTVEHRLSEKDINEIEFDIPKTFLTDSLFKQLGYIKETLEDGILSIVSVLQVKDFLPISEEGLLNLHLIHQEAVKLKYVLNSLLKKCEGKTSCAIM